MISLLKFKPLQDAVHVLKKKVAELEAENHAVHEGCAQWKQEYNDCRNILQKLVDLKTIKDADGKTPYYLEHQPTAWAEAREFLKKYQHQ